MIDGRVASICFDVRRLGNWPLQCSLRMRFASRKVSGGLPVNVFGLAPAAHYPNAAQINLRFTNPHGR